MRIAIGADLYGFPLKESIKEYLISNNYEKDIVDIWLKTNFTEGWESSIQEWLKNSMNDISSLESQRLHLRA